MKLMLLAAVAVAALARLGWAADKEAWKSRAIYFALTDRVARSSGDAGGPACSNLGDYCGGTFKGLQGKLDYIKNLGFDAVWITPVVASQLALRFALSSPGRRLLALFLCLNRAPLSWKGRRQGREMKWVIE